MARLFDNVRLKLTRKKRAKEMRLTSFLMQAYLLYSYYYRLVTITVLEPKFQIKKSGKAPPAPR